MRCTMGSMVLQGAHHSVLKSTSATPFAVAAGNSLAVSSFMAHKANMPPVAAPKKKWGQNFLRNRGAVSRIAEAIEPQPDELLLEIGPGEGVLTEKLAEFPNDLMAVEIDPELAERLRARFGSRVEILNDDATTLPLPARPFRAVGNLPYNVGTPILRRVIASANWRRAVFMLQKEVAQRLVAKPGNEQYGYLTLYAQLFATARILMTLDPGSFHPRPKV